MLFGGCLEVVWRVVERILGTCLILELLRTMVVSIWVMK